MPLKIKAPLSKPMEVEALANAGANELYCGLVTPEWSEKFTYIDSINARHTPNASMKSFEELKKSVEIANTFDLPVYLTMNSHYYTDVQVPIVIDMVQKAYDIGVDSIIIADQSLLMKLNELNIGINYCVSTIVAAFNSDAIKFYKDLGAKRVVLPRHLTMSEVKDISSQAKKHNIELEAFVLNTQCPFIDGLCTYQHVLDKNQSYGLETTVSCKLDYDIKVISEEKNPRLERTAKTKVNMWANTSYKDCGMCGIFYFNENAIDSIKIIGREFALAKKLQDLEAVKKAVDFLKTKPDIENFREVTYELYFQLFGIKCNNLVCYYPDAGGRLK